MHLLVQGDLVLLWGVADLLAKCLDLGGLCGG